MYSHKDINVPATYAQFLEFCVLRSNASALNRFHRNVYTGIKCSFQKLQGSSPMKSIVLPIDAFFFDIFTNSLQKQKTGLDWSRGASAFNSFLPGTYRSIEPWKYLDRSIFYSFPFASSRRLQIASSTDSYTVVSPSFSRRQRAACRSARRDEKSMAKTIARKTFISTLQN